MPTSLTKRLTLLFGTKGAARTQATMSRIGGGITSITNKLASMAKMAKKAGAVMVIALGAVAVSAAANFEDAMVKSTAIMGDLSSVMVNEMSAAAREVALVTKFSAKEAADAYFFLASAGLDAKQSIEAIPTVAAFAQAGNFDLALATDLLTDAQSALGLTIKNDVVKNMENMLRVSDVLVKANTLANATVQQFSEALTTEAGAALKSFNIDVEEGVAVLAAFADQGIKGQAAGTSLSRILRLMTSAAVKNADAYEKFNVRVFDASGGIRNLADIVADLENALGGLSDATRVSALDQLGFQARVQGVILPLLGTSDAIKRYESELRKAGGTTKNIAGKQMVSLKAQFGLLKDAINDVLLDVGGKMLPVITEIVQKLRTFVLENRDVILGVVTGLGKIIGLVVKVAGFVANWVAENWKILAGLGAILLAVKLVGAAIALMTSPIVLIGLGIIGLITIWNRFGDDIIKILGKVWRFIRPWVNRLIQQWVFMFRVGKLIWEELGETIETMVGVIFKHISWVADKLIAVWKFFGKIVGLAAKAASDLWSDAMDDAQKVAEAAEKGIEVSFLDKIKVVAAKTFEEDFVSSIEKGAAIGVNIMGNAADKIKKGFLGIFKPVAGGVGGAGAAAEEAAKAVRDGFAKVKLPPLKPPTIEGPLEFVAAPTLTLMEMQVRLWDRMIERAETFAEKVAVIGELFMDVFQTTGTTAFQIASAAASAFYNSVEAQSKAYFAGELNRFLNLKAVVKSVYVEITATILDAISTELRNLAILWQAKAIAKFAEGLGGNPIAFAAAAKFQAAAALAGGGAAVVSGAAAGIRQRAQQSLAQTTGQLAPLTEEERAAGVVTPRGSVAGTTRGTVTQLPPRNITIAPVTTINGEFIVIGSGGIEEAEQTLGDVIVKRIQEAEEGGEI